MPYLFAALTWLVTVGGGCFLWAAVISPSLGMSSDVTFVLSLLVGFVIGGIGTLAAYFVYDASGGY